MYTFVEVDGWHRLYVNRARGEGRPGGWGEDRVRGGGTNRGDQSAAYVTLCLAGQASQPCTRSVGIHFLPVIFMDLVGDNKGVVAARRVCSL